MTGLRLDDFLPFRLSVASNAVSGVIARAYQRRFGLTVAEWRVIAVLAERDGLTSQEIVERTVMDKVTVSRAVQALLERGLVERRPHDADRRSHLLSLTAEGRSLHVEVAPLALEFERAVLADLTGAEQAQLAALLRRLEAAASKL